MRRRLPGVGWAAMALAGLALTGCASGPGFSGDHINTTLQPREVSQSALQAAGRHTGETVLWGGRVIQTSPGQDATTLEVVAFPLQRNQRPNERQDSSGRFLIRYAGYLEPEDYREDRLVTVTGTVEEVREGVVGDAPYRYPVIAADQLYLWPERQSTDQQPRVHFGVGVGIFR